MKHCALSLKSESGDLYTFLIEYLSYGDIQDKIRKDLGEELAYIYEWQADAGSSKESSKVEKAVQIAVYEAQEFSLDEQE